MTTIAYKSNIMACDSCWTDNECQVISRTKIRRLSSGALLGSAGGNDSRWFEDALDKVKKSSQLPSYEALHAIRQDFAGLLVLPCGEVWSISTAKFDTKGADEEIGCWLINFPYAAVGSGGEVAIGAMGHGASAVEAVRVACRHDINSKPPIHSLRLRRKK